MLFAVKTAVSTGAIFSIKEDDNKINIRIIWTNLQVCFLSLLILMDDKGRIHVLQCVFAMFLQINLILEDAICTLNAFKPQIWETRDLSR